MPLDSIERIEVLHGPAGSIWGSNAVNGVINIITRAASETQGTLVDVSAGDGGRQAGHLRHGGASGADDQWRFGAMADRGSAGIGRFDVVLMDCQMPGLDGCEASLSLREVERLCGARPVPIVALMANALEGARERCLAAGMNDHLAKPFTRAQLERVLARWTQAETKTS